MTHSPSFLKHAVNYGVGNLLVHAAGFVLLPLYVRCLTAGEYGTLDILNRLGEVVLLCLLINGLRQALLAFHNQTKSESERRAVIGSALVLMVCFLGGGGLLVCAFAEPLCMRLELGSPGVLRLAVLAVFLESFAMLLLGLSQARVESSFFALVNLGIFLVRVVLCIVLVTVLGWGVPGVLIANAVAAVGFGIWLLTRECARGGLCLDRVQLRAMFWFALPFVPGGLAAFFLNSGDRFFLLKCVSREELGAYALGYKLALVVKLLSRRPLYQVWSARMYDAARQADAAVLFGKVFTRMLMAYCGVGLALCLVPAEVVAVLGGASYARAAAVIPPVVLAYLFLSCADLMDAGFYIKRRTALKTPITLTSTGITLGLYALLIPRLGILGAALATLFGFAFNTALTYLVAQRVFPVRYEWSRVTVLLAWTLLAWLAGTLLPVELWLLPVKAALWFTWLAVLWWTVLSEVEKEWARELKSRCQHWFARKRQPQPRVRTRSEPQPVAGVPG